MVVERPSEQYGCGGLIGSQRLGGIVIVDLFGFIVEPHIELIVTDAVVRARVRFTSGLVTGAKRVDQHLGERFL